MFSNTGKVLPYELQIKILRSGVLRVIVENEVATYATPNSIYWPKSTSTDTVENVCLGITQEIHNFYFGENNKLPLGRLLFFMLKPGVSGVCPHIDKVRGVSLNCLISGDAITTGIYNNPNNNPAVFNQTYAYGDVELVTSFTQKTREVWILNTNCIHGIPLTTISSPVVLMVYGWLDNSSIGFYEASTLIGSRNAII